MKKKIIFANVIQPHRVDDKLDIEMREERLEEVDDILIKAIEEMDEEINNVSKEEMANSNSFYGFRIGLSWIKINKELIFRGD